MGSLGFGDGAGSLFDIFLDGDLSRDFSEQRRLQSFITGEWSRCAGLDTGMPVYLGAEAMARRSVDVNCGQLAHALDYHLLNGQLLLVDVRSRFCLRWRVTCL